MEVAALLAKLYLLLSSVTVEQQSTRTPGRPFTIVVEGNVGCGKTTALEYFRSRTKDVDIVVEPVALWQNISGVDLLENIATDATRWGGVFQMYSGLTRYRNVMKPTDKPLRLMERSVFSERYCFLEAGHAANHKVGGKGITDPEYLLMTKWFKLLTEQLWSHLKPDLILYIRCDIDVLLRRIKKRGRSEEINIPVDFLEDMQRRHDDWLFYKNSTFPVPAKVIVLDGNVDITKFEAILNERQGEILRGSQVSLVHNGY